MSSYGRDMVRVGPHVTWEPLLSCVPAARVGDLSEAWIVAYDKDGHSRLRNGHLLLKIVL